MPPAAVVLIVKSGEDLRDDVYAFTRNAGIERDSVRHDHERSSRKRNRLATVAHLDFERAIALGKRENLTVRRVALETKPKAILCGYSAYPRVIDFAKFREIADECGALLMADIAHIAGLVEALKSSLDQADRSTHEIQERTLRGLEAVDERIFTLQERGALLQKVHFGAFLTAGLAGGFALRCASVRAGRVLPRLRRIISQNLLKSWSAVIPSRSRLISSGRPSYAACMLQKAVEPSVLPSRRGTLIA